MPRKKPFDPSTLTLSPFQISLRIPVTRVTTADIIRSGDFYVNRFYYAEQTPSVTLYSTPDRRQAIAHLSDKAKALFLHIMLTIGHNRQWVSVDPAVFMAENSIASPHTFRTAVAELCRYCFITPSQYKYIYWINPDVFFPGSRKDIFKDNLVVTKEWDRSNT